MLASSQPSRVRLDEEGASRSLLGLPPAGTCPKMMPGAASPQKKPLSRDVVVLGWVSFFNDVSSEMIYPLLPLFMIAVLGASATSLGWVEGVAQGTVAVLTAWIGWRSDRRRRRVPYVRWGYGLPLAGKALLVTAVAWPMVLLGRTIDRIGKGLRSGPRDALIADVTTLEDRGRAFGLHRAMDSAGAVVGVLIAAFLLWWLSGSPVKDPSITQIEHTSTAFRTIFAIAAGLGLVAVFFTFLLREPVPAAAAAPSPAAPVAASAASTASTASESALPRQYWIVMALLLGFSLANSSDTFLLLRAAQVGLAPGWARRCSSITRRAIAAASPSGSITWPRAPPRWRAA